MKKQIDTRERLIEATIESVYKHGYSDTTVAKISDLADTSLGTLHHHFASKEALLEQTMRQLLQTMHNRVNDSAQLSGSPRGKLWAVIESVLGDEQADDKTTAVWFSFWLQSEHDEGLRRLRDLYNRRLQSNVRAYLRMIFSEIGASNLEDRVRAGAMMLISLMHGVWVSYTLYEDLSQDLAAGRLLVWECLEMLLSRAREPLAAEEGTVATSAGLLSDVSIEIIAADMKKLAQWREYATDNMPIYVPHFRSKTNDLPERVRMAGQIIDSNLKPVVHIAARNVQNTADLERIVGGMSGVGVEEFLLLGGGEEKPVGEFDNAMQILSSGVLEHHGVKRVGFAGHPEEHVQSRDVMRRALVEKIVTAKALNMECYIVTQFCFATRPFFDFLDWVKDQQFNVPVRIGVAGRVNAAKLLKFAAACGIGTSLGFIKRQFSKTAKLANYSPDGLLAELAARIAVRNYGFPISVHFYPFGAVTETLALISDVAMGSDSTGIFPEPD